MSFVFLEKALLNSSKLCRLGLASVPAAQLSSFTSLPHSPVGMVSSILHLSFSLVLSLILLRRTSNSSLEKGSWKVKLLKFYLSKYIFILSSHLLGDLVVWISRSEIITKNFEGIASFQSSRHCFCLPVLLLNCPELWFFILCIQLVFYILPGSF